jgi:hypothetical protein
MQWSVVTAGGAVHPVVSRTLPQALPEASSGVSPSQSSALNPSLPNITTQNTSFHHARKGEQGLN